MKTKSLLRLKNEYKQLEVEDKEQFVALPDPEDFMKLHFCIYNLGDPYTHGYYHGFMKIPI